MSDYNYEEQKAIGEKIKDRISALSLTRAKVAEKSKISLASLRMIINGQKYPTGPQIKRLCRTLKITPNYLLFGAEKPDLGDEKASVDTPLISLRNGFLIHQLDKDNAMILDRLLLSLLSSQMKASEYEKLIEVANAFSRPIALAFDDLNKFASEGNKEGYLKKLSEISADVIKSFEDI